MMDWSGAFRRVHTLWALLLALSAHDALAQIPQQIPVGQTSNQPDTLHTPPDITVGTPRSGPLLEGAISRTEYRLGPADVVNVSIFGFRSQSYTLTVTPEGTLVIPTVGVVRVNGLDIESAERTVAARIRQVYQDIEVRLSLAAVRSFKVFLVGDVPAPGVREANAAMRVSEVIPVMTQDSIVRRNVVIRRANGETLPVDLARFLYLGDLSHNPFLLEGDIVQAPLVDRTVNVQGQVARPGMYELRPGETLADVLHLANVGGPFRADAADTLRLLRFSDDPAGSTFAIAREDAVGALGSGLALQPFDAVFVPAVSHYRRARTATIEGEVLRPGVYPILPGVTTVRELVEMAGGFTPNASLVNAVLRRAPHERPVDPGEQLQQIPVEFMSQTERRVLQVANQADDRNVVLDFRQVFLADGSALEVPVQDGDELVIPEIRNEITVLGAVAQPGIVTFEPDQPLDYFVQLAGGYTNRADRGEVVVLKSKLQNRLNRKDVRALEPGDQIIVPFEEPRTFMDHVRSTQSIMNTVSGFVLTVVGIQRLWDALAN